MDDRQLRLRQAYDAVKSGLLSVRQASRDFHIPRTTLRDKLENKTALIKKQKTTLTPEEESKFSQWAINMSRAGFERTRNDFLNKIQDYLNGLNEPQKRFKNDNKPGKTWYYDYLSRHSELTERTAREQGFEQATVMPSKVEGWFEALRKYINETDPYLFEEPARLYNCDESVFAFCLKSKQMILAPKSCRGDRHLNTRSTKNQITTWCCMSAMGHFIPPLIVMPGKSLTVNPSEHFAECSVGLSESGWMTSELFVSWLKNVFVPSLNERRVKRPVLLFVDGSSTHKSKQTIDICLENGIILYRLQPNATHLIQPLDLSFFGSLKHHWLEAVTDFNMKNPGMSVTKASFSLVFKAAYAKSCSLEVARTGFEKAGLFPFSKDAVLNTNKLQTSSFVPPTTVPPLSLPSTSSLSPISSPPPSSSSSSQNVTLKEKLHVLESIMTEEVREKYERRMEEGYDKLDDPFYNAWKECKCKLFSASGSFPKPSTSAGHSLTHVDADASIPPGPSTSAGHSLAHFNADVSISPAPSTSAWHSLAHFNGDVSVFPGPSLSTGQTSLDKFLSSVTPQVQQRKKKKIEVLPNMALTSTECMAYFENIEKEKMEEEKKKENRKKKLEKRQRKEGKEQKEEKKKQMKERKKQRKERKKQMEEEEKQIVEKKKQMEEEEKQMEEEEKQIEERKKQMEEEEKQQTCTFSDYWRNSDYSLL